MSTIDIGIAELPAIQPIRVTPRTFTAARPAPAPVFSGGDFYVGSTKIESLPAHSPVQLSGSGEIA